MGSVSDLDCLETLGTILLVENVPNPGAHTYPSGGESTNKTDLPLLNFLGNHRGICFRLRENAAIHLKTLLATSGSLVVSSNPGGEGKLSIPRSFCIRHPCFWDFGLSLGVTSTSRDIISAVYTLQQKLLDYIIPVSIFSRREFNPGRYPLVQVDGSAYKVVVNPDFPRASTLGFPHLYVYVGHQNCTTVMPPPGSYFFKERCIGHQQRSV